MNNSLLYNFILFNNQQQKINFQQCKENGTSYIQFNPYEKTCTYQKYVKYYSKKY